MPNMGVGMPKFGTMRSSSYWEKNSSCARQMCVQQHGDGILTLEALRVRTCAPRARTSSGVTGMLILRPF